jgi:hypothetical protein
MSDAQVDSICAMVMILAMWSAVIVSIIRRTR